MAALVSSLTLGAQGAAVKTLQSNLALAGIVVPAAESAQTTFGTGTREAVLQLQVQFNLPATGILDAVSAAVLAGAAAATSQGQWIVNGRVAMDYGAPADGLALRLYAIGFGGAGAMLAETKTDGNGVFTLSYPVPTAAPNIEVRALDPGGNEVAISQTVFGAQNPLTLNLVAPSGVRPLAPEYQRLAADMTTQIGGIAKLATAQETDSRHDITLVSNASGWDARLVTLAALASKQTTTTGLGSDVLYALYRAGLPTDPQQLALVSPDDVSTALTAANQSGIVNLAATQLQASVTAFQNFATNTRLAMTAPGTVSSFQTLLNDVVTDPGQQAAFANLFFSTEANSPDLWSKAAQLQMPAQTITALQLQGKLLQLTANNAALTRDLQQQIGSIDKLPALADAGLHESAAWQDKLKQIAGTVAGLPNNAALAQLIPSSYTQTDVADRLTAYAGDLARLVRLSFPTQVAAIQLDNKTLNVAQGNAGAVASFLRAAAPLGFELGRTPLNSFLNTQTANLPALDAASAQALKDVHRTFQLSPSNESMQAMMANGLTSAYQIAAYGKDKFIAKYGALFPSAGEALLVFAKAQQISSVTFNFYVKAKQLDNAPPVYGLSGSTAARQAAKDAVVKQFPTMESLFGNIDFCQCSECRSVLSPSAYFVDLLEFLGKSGKNANGYTPLDVLVGKDAALPGRRPDLAALPLTCENTNTALPYIDLVNEIFEYYIRNNRLDANAAYDTGDASTDDLNAEPAHTLPEVYTDVLSKAVYPLGLPFDLWIETVRGFLNYFNIPLAQMLETLRPDDALELYTDAGNRAYYRTQIFAEALGLSPSEYAVLTVTDLATNTPSVANWFALYGYADEATALNGKPNPTDASQFDIEPLKSARNLSECLGITYQDVADLVQTGFLNPGLDKLVFQFNRFGISLQDAFAYTGQPGYTALTAQARADFEAILAAVKQSYQASQPGFDAKAWLTALLPAGYAKGVWVLDDPDTGCDFTNTTLQYADGGALTPLDFLKFNLFVRLWKKLGWTIEEVDRALQLFFPSAALPAWSDPGFAAAFSAAWKTALANLAHLDAIHGRLKPVMGRLALLPFWSNLPVQGANPLYARLFLTASVLGNDPAFDDPAGAFPASGTTDFLSAHLPALLGVLGLTADEVDKILADAGAATVTQTVGGQSVTAPGFSLANISACYRYSVLAKCLGVSVADFIALKALSGLDVMQPPGAAAFSVLEDDTLFTRMLAFLDQMSAVEASGLDAAALQYLLRHQFDPAGPYRQDANAQMTLAQSIAVGLRQIASQNALPANLAAAADDVLQQKLAALLPAPVLQTFAALIGNGQSYSASQDGVAAGSQIDPTPFAAEAALRFSYDATTQTQTVTCQGVLLDWKKAQLLQINNSALFSGLLDGVQAQAMAAFAASVEDMLGAWSSLAEYEAVQLGVAAAIAPDPLTKADPSLRLSYDQVEQLQWLAYRGVLTDAKKAALSAIDASAALGALLADVQNQAMPDYRQFMGAVLAIFTQGQTYVSTAAVPPANAIDPAIFAAYPQIQFSYDAQAQTETLTVQGILTDASRATLAGLLPASAVLPPLLQDVRNQALHVFQTCAQPFLTVAATDLDIFAQGITGLTGGTLQRQAKAALLQAFQPLMTRKLSQALVVQTVSSALGTDPAFTEDLLTQASLLNDPTHPGKSLLPTYLAVGTQGVTAACYGTPDQSGAPLASGTAAAVDLSDPINPNAGKTGTGSARFEGYLQVPTDGPYRFFAALGNTGARAVLTLISPDSAALLPAPLLDATAAKDNDEASQFVRLQGGVPYRFTADFTQLGANGARLLMQGENLAKGPLGQVILMPGEAIAALIRAETLIAKALQLIGALGLDERELTYLAANGTRFGNLRLSALPTQAGDDTPAGAVALFKQFLALADYAALRKGPLGGTDGLVSVFANVGVTYSEVAGSYATNTNPDTPWTRLGNLTRRDPRIVRDTAAALGLIEQTVAGGNYQITALPEFASIGGIRRLWNALQLVQVVGIPVASLIAATLIVSRTPPAGSPAPDAIAATLKNAVKARYDIDAWRPVAKSVFDKLRQRKRDALAAWLLDALGLTSANQLFEYFLVDPGMEPVVQTSRIRLALSSVQTFVQRCLLDLENGFGAHPERNVYPSAIDADWWSWMKRYRVWEANREIFLYPENWMEPELRLDKSDIFQQLESALTQGDVTSDLVESAFLDYLKGLDVRARLDIVATYLDQDLTDPGKSTLHVLARTYGVPHKYFYRTYADSNWSAWTAVQPDIEGNHMAIAVWRGKLNLFWLTFSKKQQANAALSGLTFNQLGNNKNISDAAAQELLQVQLNWCEYFQGKWSDRVSTDMTKTETIQVSTDFDVNSIGIRVSKESDDAAIRICLDIPGFIVGWYYGRGVPVPITLFSSHAFRVTSRNCDPAFSSSLWVSGPKNPYNATGVDATVRTGSATLEASFVSSITTTSTTSSVTIGPPTPILQAVNDYGLVMTSNAVVPPFLDPAEPFYQEAGALVSPFFYKDLTHPANPSEMTFFVQPSLTEVTLREWVGWAIPVASSNAPPPIVLGSVSLVAQVPQAPIPVNPGDPVYAIHPMLQQIDWVTSPATAVTYGGTAIGRDGGLDVSINTAPLSAGATASPAAAGTLAGGLAATNLGRVVVGASGLNASQFQAINAVQTQALADAAMKAGITALRQA